MNYEQKYNDALDAARHIYDDMKSGGNFGGMEDLEVIFPELADSEDERIRKTLLDEMMFLKGKGQTKLLGLNINDIIAYLEKQKEQKHPNGCFTCDEYKKGYEAGRSNGFTAGYNKAMKEQKPAEWGEEDEKMVQFWNMYYEHKVGDWPNKDVVEHLERFREWINNRFRTLRPQPKQEMAKEVSNRLKNSKNGKRN